MYTTGTGVTGALFPGCPETFQESQGARRSEDQHQRIVRFREGDVLAFPPGVAHWCFNDGKEPVVAVSLLDIRNSENQLDFSPRVRNHNHKIYYCSIISWYRLQGEPRWILAGMHYSIHDIDTSIYTTINLLSFECVAEFLPSW